MKDLKSIICFSFLVIFFISCDNNERDIYKLIPKGSKLDLDILSSSKQIFFNGNDLVLVNDISDDWDIKNNHLLFYNNLKLYGAEYLPAQKVEFIDSNIIGIVKNAELESKSSRFISDIPKEYSYEFLESNKVNGNQRIGNKIIKKILINSVNRDSLVMNILYSDDLYIGLRGSKILKDDSTINKFNKKRQMIFSISDLIIDYDENIISIESLSDNNSLIRDNMIISSKEVINDFYKQIIEELK